MQPHRSNKLASHGPHSRVDQSLCSELSYSKSQRTLPSKSVRWFRKGLHIFLLLASWFLSLHFGTAQCWEEQTPPGEITTWNDVHFVSPDTGFVCGSAKKLASTVDGGKTWTISIFSGDLAYFSSLHFDKMEPNKGWLAGTSGEVYYTIDKGTNWILGNVSNIEFTTSDIYFGDAQNGWFVTTGSTDAAGWQSKNGGMNWSSKGKIPISNTKGLNAVFFINKDTGWIAGNEGVIVRTTNGSMTPTSAVNWISSLDTTLTKVHVKSLFFLNATDGWACGTLNSKGVILKTIDGGVSWTTSTTSNTINDLRSIFFISKDTGWVAGTMGGILHTTDGGDSWTNQVSGVTTSLNRIYFTDSQNGWAVGANGIILKYTALGVAAPFANTPCSGDTLQLDANVQGDSYNWSGPNSFTSTVKNPTIPNAQPFQSGEYTVTVTKGSCQSVGTVEVSILPLPTVTVALGAFDCPQGGRFITASVDPPTDSVSWSGPGGYSSDTLSPLVSVKVKGMYILTATHPNGCKSFTNLNVDLLGSIPDLTIQATHDILTCTNDTSTLSGNSNTSGVTYKWSTGGTTKDIAVNNPGSYAITITDPANGCTNAASIILSELKNAPDSINVTGGSINCTSDSIQLGAEANPKGNVSFQWISPGGTFLPPGPTPSVSAPGTYQLVVTNNINGCTSTASITVTSSETLPDLSGPVVTGKITCKNLTVPVSASSSTPGVSFSWSGPNSFTSTGTSFNASLPGTYSVTITAPNNCTKTGTVQVEQDIVKPEFTISSQTDTLTCTKSKIILTVVTSETLSYAWSTGSTSSAIEVTSGGLYILTGLNPQNGCTTIDTAIILADTIPPVILDFTTDTLDCSGMGVQLSVNAEGNDLSYKWLNPAGDSISNEISPFVKFSGDYQVIVTGKNGCTKSQIVTVFNSPDKPQNISVSVSGPITCIQPAVTIEASSSSNVTYSWTGPSGFSSSLPQNNITVPGTYFVVIKRLDNDCQDQQSLVVKTDLDKPIPALFPIDTLTCKKLDLDLGVTITNPRLNNPYLFQWEDPMGKLIGNSPIQGNVTAAGNYRLTITDTINGCDTVLVFPVISASTAPNIELVIASVDCQEAKLEAISNSNDLSYQWFPEDPSQVVPTERIVSESNEYAVLVTSENGCTARANVDVVLYKDELISFISPNQDGVNEKLKVNPCSQMTTFGVTIFNRWGQIVLRSDDFEKDYPDGWDGSIDDSPVTDGQYYYIVESDGKIRKSPLTILR